LKLSLVFDPQLSSTLLHSHETSGQVKNTWVSGHLTVPVFWPLTSLTVVFFSEICKEFEAIAVPKRSLASLYFRCVSLLLYLVFRTNA
jgi:hypothetical protein